MKKKNVLKMLKYTLWIVMVFSVISCSEDTELNETIDLLQGESITTPDALRTATVFGEWDFNDMLDTAIFPKIATYDHSLFPTYDFTPYFINGESAYNAENYDLMAHFQYKAPEALTGAVVELTFPQIKYIFPHIINSNKHYVYSVNNVNNQTVITTITDLVEGWNPMFCFMIKVDCGKGKSGYATFWTDMKVNGVSVKGSVKNKVFSCN